MDQHTTSQTVTEWPRWLNLKDGAKYAGCSVNTFRRHLVATGKVKAHITSYRTVYDRDEIDQAIENWY